MPKVSIVMPVYSGEKYLKEAIESILAQTFSDWEFIIINEHGSNQAATNILNNYKKLDKRIHIIQNKERLGISASLNLGFDIARGEYVARMDGDDISGHNRLERQVAFMDAHPNIALCGIQAEIFGEESWEWQCEIDPCQIFSDALFFIPILHPTAMFRKSVLEKYQFRYNEGYSCSEDYDLFTRMSRDVEISNINDISLFRYRRYPTAATYANKAQGDTLCKILLKDSLTLIGMDVTDNETDLLYLHTGLYGLTDEVLRKKFLELDLLLKKILQANMRCNRYSMVSLCKTLYKRWKFAYDVIRYQNYSNEEQVPIKIKEIYTRSIFVNPQIFLPYLHDITVNPTVSVVMPVYNGEKYLYESIFSIIKQEYKDWELLIVNDASSDDTVLIIQEFAKQDNRIQMYTNEENMRISRTLNRGVDLAKGKYIARMDDDDISLSSRLKKQVEFLDSHHDIALVGTFQRHFGKTDWIHSPPEAPQLIKASLLFKCEVCHSTVMFRRKEFLDNNLRYNPAFLSEDFELWSRAIHIFKFATIQEILGEYRWNGDNITAGKAERFDAEAMDIIAHTLKTYLGINVAQEDKILLSGWTNPFYHSSELQERHKALMNLISEQNNILHVYDDSSLKKVIKSRISWGQGKNEQIQEDTVKNLDYTVKRTFKTRLRGLLKRILKKIAWPFYRAFYIRVIAPIHELQNSTYDISGRQSYIIKKIDDHDGHLWDYEQELIKQIQDVQDVVVELSTQLQIMERQHNEEMAQMQEFIRRTVETSKNELESCVCNAVSHGVAKLSQTLDSRICVAEENLSQTLDGCIWKAEKNLCKTLDNRIWQAELIIIKALKSDIWNLRYEFEKQIDRASNNDSPHLVYNSLFYEENRYGSVMSAHEVFRVLLPKIKPSSMVDFGCGTGTWLYVAKQFGVTDIYGMDGEYISKNLLMIAAEEFHATNLEENIILNKQYDMAVSLEVAEHISKANADSFVHSLCEASNIVLFSAAHLGQGGDNHVNEQPIEYWQEKFELNGFRMIEIRGQFAKNFIMEDWYKQNIALYVKNSEHEKIAKLIVTE